VHTLVWLENLKGKGQLGRLRRRWEDNSRMCLREIWWEEENWIHLAQDRDNWRTLANMVMCFPVA
jgi:hypothetical protein